VGHNGKSSPGGKDIELPSIVKRYVTNGTCRLDNFPLLITLDALDSCFLSSLSIVFFCRNNLEMYILFLYSFITKHMHLT